MTDGAAQRAISTVGCLPAPDHMFITVMGRVSFFVLQVMDVNPFTVTSTELPGRVIVRQQQSSAIENKDRFICWCFMWLSPDIAPPQLSLDLELLDLIGIALLRDEKSDGELLSRCTECPEGVFHAPFFGFVGESE